ncbi:MAG TPA: hypothetical protein G4O18_09325 [Dehalococcoidia bacterium]|nr:hypothetical protein [Dehalococcoidia bacterium]
MKKKWFAIMSALMVLVLLFTGLPAMAQDGTVEDVEAVSLPNALVIRAPRLAYVGQEVTIGVYERGTGAPVGGAFVFALSRENAEALQAEMATLRASEATGTEGIDYQALGEAYGELIGITGNNGEVYHAFDEAGWYLLLAVKGGYYPGFAPIAVRPVVKALGIKAPQNARVGEEVTITVFERGTQQPVENALVFAVSPGAAEALQAEMTTLREDTTVDVASIDYEALARRYGELIGITNEYGEVHHAFDKAGRYLLIAVKADYLPGFARINIWPTIKALGIKAPDTARVGEEITITVFERGTGVPVEGAGVWALSRENAEIVKEEVARLQEETATLEDIDYEELVRIYGEFIDWTNENGEVYHAFDEAGCYVLVAVKRGYLPAFRVIRVGTVPKALVIDAPKTAPVGEIVTIGVSERLSGEAVEGAFVFALSRDNAVALNEEITRIREAGEIAAVDIDYKALADCYGELIGITNGAGEVYHAFDEVGWYLLLAVKPDYLPGFAPIRIGTLPKALGIRAPQMAKTGEEVTMVVFERRTQSPVEGAGVWAVSRDNIDVLKEQIAQLNETAVAAAADVDYEAIVRLVGEFIDWTDENGEVRHTFEEPGLYLLVAIKKGYYPGCTLIVIRSVSTDSSGNALQATRARLVQAVQANGPQLIRAQVQANTSLSPHRIQRLIAVKNQIQAVNQPVSAEDTE